MDEAAVERVRAAVRAIPAGQVRSYGEVAEEAGLRSPRLIGRILAEDGHDLPWHRVVRADGSFAPHIAAEQAARLRVEGVLAADGRVPRELRPRRRRTLAPAERHSRADLSAEGAGRRNRSGPTGAQAAGRSASTAAR